MRPPQRDQFNDRVAPGLFSEMYKIEQLLKPLTDTVPKSGNSTRGHGLAAETPTIRTLTTALLYCARTCTFLAGPTQVRPFPHPTPRRLDALPGPDSTGQTRKLPSLPHTGRGFPAPVIEPQPLLAIQSHGLGQCGKPPVAETFKQLFASGFLSRGCLRVTLTDA
jgi:hypothetical protein